MNTHTYKDGNKKDILFIFIHQFLKQNTQLSSAVALNFSETLFIRQLHSH